MGRRSESRRLNLATRQERGSEFSVAEWLLKPKQKATREEVYALLRQYHWEHGRQRLRERSPVVRFLYAVWLTVSFPFRVAGEWLLALTARWRTRSDRKLASRLKAQLADLDLEVKALAEAGDDSARNDDPPEPERPA